MVVHLHHQLLAMGQDMTNALALQVRSAGFTPSTLAVEAGVAESTVRNMLNPESTRRTNEQTIGLIGKALGSRLTADIFPTARVTHLGGKPGTQIHAKHSAFEVHCSCCSLVVPAWSGFCTECGTPLAQ